jgi:glutamate 5-kinase
MIFDATKRIVIKCGSSLLVAQGEVRAQWLESLANDIAHLRAQNKEVLIVTSGAVALGRKTLGLGRRKLKLEEKQAAAATGQVVLMQAWQKALNAHSINCAQTLLTAYDTERRRNWLNARATFDALFAMNVVPIVNENDTIATDEIRYGDNDRLAARVAQMIGANSLVLLSDIDGLYEANPRDNPNAKHLPIIENITPEIEAMAGGVNLAAGVGSGGMRTKIDAANIATSGGANVIIANGEALNPISKIINGARHTIFTAKIDPQTARLAWLSHNLKPQGNFIVDDGAIKALKKGGSLLPVGVTSIDGSFERGDAVAIIDCNGAIIARGLSSYNSSDAAFIIGKKSSEIEDILGYSGRPALVHRDDMVVG